MFVGRFEPREYGKRWYYLVRVVVHGSANLSGSVEKSAVETAGLHRSGATYEE